MAKTAVDRILFGAAYYDEYIPRDIDRIDTDMQMMRDAGINVIRIAESTWSTCEPQPGEFDFTHIDRALDAARRYGIQVIVGTPTYAVPAWLVRMHPDVLAQTPAGQGKYGPRQIMDIVNPAYRYYGERVIRALISHVAYHPSVIGYQIDNETKYYDSVSPDMQMLFVKHLRKRFHDDLDAMNAAFGLDYWSNRIDAWEDFPDVSNSINASLSGAFDAFRRSQVAKFLQWQGDIVREVARDDQFITHNFDYDWRGYSFGIQPAVDHFKAAEAVDIAGVYIYHPSEDGLTGKEIAFGGDVSRSVKGGRNYIVLETEAQGQHGWLPYPGQLRLQAYSHLASGADGVMYWHWHSIHNSFETYWRGLLSHDLEPNPTYREAGVFGREIAQDPLASQLIHMRKHNAVAIMVSNESLNVMQRFYPYGAGMGVGSAPGEEQTGYNEVVRRVYDALFDLNVECDFIPTDASNDTLSRYGMVITPALYCASQNTIDALRDYVRQGGHLVSTMRSFVSNEDVTVWHDKAPHDLHDVFGMSYNQFTRPQSVAVEFNGPLDDLDGAEARGIIELLKPDTDCEVLARYRHYAWGAYAAITRHSFGDGDAEWIATDLQEDVLRNVMREAVEHAGVAGVGLALAGVLSVRQGENAQGRTLAYMLNYSDAEVSAPSPVSGTVVVAPRIISFDGTVDEEATRNQALQQGHQVSQGEDLVVPAWNLVVVMS